MNRKYHLLKKSDFEKVLSKKKQKIFGKNLIVYYLKNDKIAFSRFGIIVSKKFFKKAFIRNYYRRVIREGIRLSNFFSLSGYDLVFYCKKEISENFNFNNLKKEIFKIITKIKIKSKNDLQ